MFCVQSTYNIRFLQDCSTGKMPGWKQKGQNGLQNKERTRAVRQLRQWFSTLKTKKTAPRTGTFGERMEGENLANSGQLLQGAPPNRAAAVKEKGRRIDSWRCDFPVAPQRMGCGREENGGPPELRIARFPFHFPPAGRHRNFVSRLCKGGNVRWSGSRNGVAASPLGSRAACPCKKKARASCPCSQYPSYGLLAPSTRPRRSAALRENPKEKAGCRTWFPRGRRCGICLALEGACGYSPGASGAVSHPGETPGGNGVPSSIIQLNP